MREKYETLSLATLKELAKGRGMRAIRDAAGKGDGGARKKAVRIRTGEGKGGCRDCAGSGKGGNSRNVRRKRYRIRGGQTGAAATDEWQSVRGDTQHPDIRQPYLEQSGKTDECDTTSGKCTGAWQKKRHAAGTDVCGAYTAECR